MLSLSAQTRAFVAIAPIDFRCGIDRLSFLCRCELGENPIGGAAFVFRNRKRTAIKVLFYDGQGYWLCQKRLSIGKLTWWPSSATPVKVLAARELQILLWNGNPTQAAMAEDWQPVNSDKACV